MMPGPGAPGGGGETVAPPTQNTEQDKAREKHQREKERAEEIRKIAEKEQERRIREKIIAKLRGKGKDKQKPEKNDDGRKKHEHFSRIAKELIKSGEFTVLLEDQQRGEEKQAQTKPKEQLSYETEVLLNQLFQKFNPNTYENSQRQAALMQSIDMHYKAHRALQATIARATAEEGEKSQIVQELKELEEASKKTYKDKVKEAEESPAAPTPDGEGNAERRQIPSLEETDKDQDKIQEINAKIAELKNDSSHGLARFNKKKAIDMERMANFRQLKVLKRKLAEGKISEDEAEAYIQGILMEQFALLASTDIPQETAKVGESKRFFEVLQNSDIIGQISNKYGKVMFGEEARAWGRIASSSELITSLHEKLQAVQGANVEATLKHIRQEGLSPKELELIETLSHPEIVGRIRMYEADQARENAEKDPKTIIKENQIEFETWLNEATPEERLAAAKEDIMLKLMMLDPASFNQEDIILSLRKYGFKTDLAGVSEDLLKKEGAEEIEASQITNLIDTATKINEQYLTAQDIALKTDPEFDTESTKSEIAKAKTERNKLLEAIQADLVDKENPEVNIDLVALADKGLIKIQATASGLAIVIDGHNYPDTPDAASNETRVQLKALATLLGADYESMTRSGLGVTFQEGRNSEFLKYLQSQGENNKVPSLSIIVTPEEASFDIAGNLLLAHETQDYLFDNLLLQSPSQSLEDQALRELVSRIFDAKLDGDNKLTLTDLYLKADDANLNTAQREQLLRLIRTLESIITKETNAAGLAINNDKLKEYATAQARKAIREDLALAIVAQAGEKGIESISDEFINNLVSQYGITSPTVGSEGMYAQSSSYINNLKRNKFKYSFTPTGTQPLIGHWGDSTNPANTAFQEAQYQGMFQDTGHKPPQMLGGPGKGHYAGWAYSNNARPIQLGDVVPGLRKFSNLLGAIPAPFIQNYELKRAVGARWARSHNPRLRDTARNFMGDEYLGANPAKVAKWFNPKAEEEMKRFLPGVVNAYRINEERERMPVSMQMHIEDMTYTGRGVQWMGAILGEAGIGQLKQQQYLSRLLGTKFGFDALEGRYKFKKNPDQLRAIYDFEEDVIKKNGLTDGGQKPTKFMTKHFKEDPASGKFGYQHHDKRFYKRGLLGQAEINPWVGSAKGAARLLNPFKRWDTGEGSLQDEVSNYYKEYVTRSRLPAGDGEKVRWMDQIGTKYKEFLDNRDAYVALMTLKDEAAHFATRPIVDDEGNPQTAGEKYSLYHMINLIHIAEEQRGAGSGTWAVNTTGKDIKLKFRERGKVQTITVRPGENLVDAHGNLIFNSFKMKDDLEVGKDGFLKLKNPNDLEAQKYWGRLVGDRLNPQLRYLRLNSQDGMQRAVDMFGGNRNIDEGFDEENVLVRTDAVKDAILNLQFEMMEHALREGVPPDKRYEVDWVDDPTKPGYKTDIIKFQEEFDYPAPNGAIQKAITFNNDGTASAEFKNYLDQVLRDYFDKVVKQPPDRSPLYQKYKREILAAGARPTRYQVSEMIKEIIGTKNYGFDPVFEGILKFKDDPTWSHPYRQEVPGLQGIPEYELTTTMRTLRAGVGEVFRGRYETGQNYLMQWQYALKTIGQMERLGYAKTNYYKGISTMITRGTNAWMLGSMAFLAATGLAIPVYIGLGAYAARTVLKPHAAKQHKRWLARRLKALERFDNVVGAAGVFQKPMQGELPIQFELKNMHQWTEKITFWLEELGQTDEPEDWYPGDDFVIKKTGDLFAKLESQLGEWAEA